MKSKHRIGLAILLLAILASVLFFVVSRSSDESRPTQLEKVSLRLQWLTQAQFAGYFVAKEKGFYSDRGLDLTINPGGQDFNALSLVAAGSDTFGIWTADQVLIGLEKSAPVKVLGAVFDRSLAAFMVHEDSNIASPKDFEGKTVGLYAGYDTETIYLYLLSKYNVDRSTIKETPLQYDLGRFFTRQVDVWPVYIVNQPIVAARNGVRVRLLTPDQFGLKLYSDVLIANTAFLEKKPQLAQAFLEATALGWEYAAKNPDETIAILKRIDPSLDEIQQRQMLEVSIRALGNRNPKFAMSKENWTSLSAMLKSQGLLKSDFDALAAVGMK